MALRLTQSRRDPQLFHAPDFEALEDAGLLSKEKLLADLSGVLGIVGEETEEQRLP